MIPLLPLINARKEGWSEVNYVNNPYALAQCIGCLIPRFGNLTNLGGICNALTLCNVLTICNVSM